MKGKNGFMKKAVFLVVFAFLCVFCFGIKSLANEGSEGKTYTVAQDGGEYVLSVYEGGTPSAVLRGGASELFNHILSLPENSEVVFSSVVVNENVELYEATLTFKGALSFSSGTSLTAGREAKITFDGLTLGFECSSEGNLRIKGGSVSMTDSSVFGSRSGAVLVDYSASSSFTLISGVVSAECESAAINVDNGSLYILGGRIDNTAGVGVCSDSSLYLTNSPVISGIGYDIITDKPINLSYGSSSYLGGAPLSVKFCREFHKGDMTAVFYNATAQSIERISLYDTYGVLYSLTYFDSSVHTSEREFCAVYQPYTVKIFDCNGSSSHSYLLSGDLVSEPELSTRTGFDFVGWYTDPEGEKKYDFATPVTSDFALYPIYSLKPPSFKINSVSTVYDGEEHTLSFDELSHPLDGEDCFYSFEWLRDGEQISTASALRYKNTSDSGKYECIVSFSYGNATSNVKVKNITLTVEKLLISPPEIEPLRYTGSPLSPSISPSSLYTFISVSEADVGSYPVTFFLTDTDNYAWCGSETNVISVEFKILKAENLWSEELTAGNSYPGALPNHKATPLFGSVRYLYSQSEDGEYTDVLPAVPGIYYVKAVVDEGANYTGLVSSPVSFTVKEESILSMSVATYPERLSYTAFEQLDGAGVRLFVKYDSGREETVGIDKISVSYQSGNGFRYGDSAVILSYRGERVSLPVTVSRADYDISGIVLEDFSVIYNGNYRTAEISLPSIIGKDGVPLGISLTGGGRDVGVYQIKISFSVDSTNYNAPPQITANMDISPLSVKITWSELSFTYDGGAHVPTAYYIDAFGVPRYPSVTGAATYAGEGYMAKAVLPSDNYIFENSEVKFNIEKADFDLSNVKWSSQIFVYNGEKHEVFVDGLPDELQLAGYSDSSATDAGEYLATAYVSYDTKNYNSPEPICFSWKIEPAQYDVSSLIFYSVSAIYDGNIHYPSVVGELTPGIDGSVPSYTFTTGATHVSEGRVTVLAVFTSGSKNYHAPATKTLYVEIKPRGIYVTWSESNFVYNGEPQTPVATAGESKITVTGEEVNAGAYTAEATADNTDFYVINSTFPFLISPAQNSWTLLPKIENIFASGILAPVGEALSGEITYKYYSDESCLSEIDAPTLAGIYYAVAVSQENGNYTELRSEPMRFEIVAVVATEIAIELLATEKRAFELLSPEDFRAIIYYNDGSESVVSGEFFEVLYENADSLRCSDEYVTLNYLNFSQKLPIEVQRADYDMSGVRWINTESVYDGKLKSPVITGLPKGISLIGYIGADSANAGVYTVSAQVSYDSENYNAPQIPTCEFVINKCILEPPEYASSVYNGQHQLPSLGEQFVITNAEGYRNAGKYTLTLRLEDSVNYAFASGEDEYILEFEITSRPLYARVEDMRVYKWEEAGEAIWHLTDGEYVEGDVGGVCQYIENGLIYIASTDSNYVIYAEPGKLERLSTPSPQVAGKIFFASLIVILFLMLCAVLYIYRRRVADAFSSIRSFSLRAANLTQTGFSDNTTTLPSSEKENEEIPDAKENSEASEEKEHPLEEYKKADNDDSDFEEHVSEILEENKDYDDKKSDNSGVLDFDFGFSIDSERADLLISDKLAKGLVRRERTAVNTRGRQKGIVNVDTLSENFSAGDRVDVNILKSKSLIPYDTAYIKVLARGIIDKPLSVYANDFSLSAVKMIALSGGEAVKVHSVKYRRKAKNQNNT